MSIVTVPGATSTNLFRYSLHSYEYFIPHFTMNVQQGSLSQISGKIINMISLFQL